MKAVNTIESQQTTTETSTTIKTLSKAPKAASMMIVGVSVVAVFFAMMMIFAEENNGSGVVFMGTAIAMILGSAFVFYEKRKRRNCTATSAGDGVRAATIPI